MLAPEIHIRPDGGMLSIQPPTHATRSCAMWEADDDDGPDDGEWGPMTDPKRSKIRNLFPIQPAPVAA